MELSICEVGVEFSESLGDLQVKQGVCVSES